MARQTGRTTQQMELALPKAVFVWCNEHLDYPKSLLRKIGRDDLLLVAPWWLVDRRWQGMRPSDIVLDHACVEHFGEREWEAYHYAMFCLGLKEPR
jgi:hypothetical protein